MIDKLLNINSYCNYQLFDQSTKTPIVSSEILKMFPPSLAEIELSKESRITIPMPVAEVYQKFRPTPLFRATAFEKAIETDCEIYIKDEGGTFSGNHKANSAFFIAYLCKRDGIRTITTETTGNWGTALAQACSYFGVNLLCFIDEQSHKLRPDRKAEMEKAGAQVIVVPLDQSHHDLLTLSADSAIQYTKNMSNAAYVFGSVYGYFVIPQTIIGAEAKQQLAEIGKYPDIVVGSCGGGANILGTASVFIADAIDSGRELEVFSAEADSCPILSNGVPGYYSIDSQNYYPDIYTYGLDGLVNNGQYIGGLGSTIVAPAVFKFHSDGIIQSKTFTPEEARFAADVFRSTEGKYVALETGYQLAAVIHKAKQNSKKVILVNISSGANDTQFYKKG